jgi:hypothetical protein
MAITGKYDRNLAGETSARRTATGATLTGRMAGRSVSQGRIAASAQTPTFHETATSRPTAA